MMAGRTPIESFLELLTRAEPMIPVLEMINLRLLIAQHAEMIRANRSFSSGFFPVVEEEASGNLRRGSCSDNVVEMAFIRVMYSISSLKAQLPQDIVLQNVPCSSRECPFLKTTMFHHSCKTAKPLPLLSLELSCLLNETPAFCTLPMMAPVVLNTYPPWRNCTSA